MVLCALLVIAIELLCIQNQDLKSENRNYQTQITTLKEASQQALAEAQEAQSKAIIQMKKAQSKDTLILEAQVSPKCKGAITWAIQQGRAFA